MHESILTTASRLSDEALLARVTLLVGRERFASVELIAHLAELDTRDVYLGQGVKSLYRYCTEILHLSEHAAYNRIGAARAARKFPAILGLLADGSVNVTTVTILGPHLTPENHRAVLAEATHHTKDEVEVIKARLAPRPDVPPTIRKLPAPAPVAATLSLVAVPEGAVSTTGTPPAPVVQSPPPPPRPVVEPLAPERYRLQFTVGKTTHDKLRRIQDLLAREIPDGDPAAIFDRALTLLEKDIQKRKLGATEKPRTPRPTKPRSRHVPAHIRRAVNGRDGGRCAFVSKDGRRCTERKFLEYHHVKPYAADGEMSVANISLRCRMHNAYEAEQIFGRFDPSLVRETPADYVAFGNGEQVLRTCDSTEVYSASPQAMRVSPAALRRTKPPIVMSAPRSDLPVIATMDNPRVPGSREAVPKPGACLDSLGSMTTTTTPNTTRTCSRGAARPIGWRSSALRSSTPPST